MRALGRLKLRHGPRRASDGNLSGKVSASLPPFLGRFGVAPVPFSIGFFDASAFGRGFDAVTVRVETNNRFVADRENPRETVFEQRFEGPHAAREGLRDLWIEVPPLIGSVEVLVELEAGRRFARLDLGVLVAVPPDETP